MTSSEPGFDLAAFPRRIHELVERHAAERPEALALIDHDGRRLTWRSSAPRSMPWRGTCARPACAAATGCW